ncbi:MAG: methylated-DNA--[protein]-cysteine S-methyltransferase [Alphaproteobacteria bacterium]
MTAFRATVTSPLGPLIVVTHQGHAGRPVLGGLDFADRLERLSGLLGKAPWAGDVKDAPVERTIADALEAYFDGDLHAVDALVVEPWGSPFEGSVWNALRTIPAGTTTSYGSLAKTLDRPTAARAVGRANGRNPVGIVIPCHRVIGSGGALTGYAGGLERKAWLLRHEGVALM